MTAPSPEARLTVTIGLLHRRAFRRLLLQRQFEFAEEKGVLDSLFMVHGEPNRILALLRLLEAERREQDA